MTAIEPPAIDTGAYVADLAKAMKEWPTLHELVRQALIELGYLAFHAYDARRSTAGFPDFLALRRSDFRLIAIELKREGRDPNENQREWLDLFAAAGVETFLWRPSDWLSNRILVELAR